MEVEEPRKRWQKGGRGSDVIRIGGGGSLIPHGKTREVDLRVWG